MAATHAKFSGKPPSEAMLRTHFTQLDANSDGSVTFAEFKASHDKMEGMHPERRFSPSPARRRGLRTVAVHNALP